MLSKYPTERSATRTDISLAAAVTSRSSYFAMSLDRVAATMTSFSWIKLPHYPPLAPKRGAAVAPVQLPFFTPRFPLLFPPSRPREWKVGQEVCREVGEHELDRTTVRTNAIGTPSSLPSPQKHTNLTHRTAAIPLLHRSSLPFQSSSLSSACHCSWLSGPSTG